MCFQLVFILMQNISEGKLGSNSLNAALPCCCRKRTCATQILEQQLIREGKTFAVDTAYGMNWKPSNKQRRARSHTLSHTHCGYTDVRYQWVFPQFNIVQSWLVNHLDPSLKDFSRNAVQNSPETSSRLLMILRTEWCHALVHGVLGTEILTPAECTTASPSVCVSMLNVCVH